MQSIAIVGTGVAGLTCAWYLKDLYRISLYEREDYPGGHTHTVEIEENGKTIPVDTGFMVFNDPTYPNINRMFDELQVPSVNTDMSFGVHDTLKGSYYTSQGFNGFFACRKNLIRPSHWKLASGIKKLFETANRFVDAASDHRMTVAEFFEQTGLDPSVARDFLLPMASAIWSTHGQRITDYPALSLFRFMRNHGLLGIGTQFQWKTIPGGSKVYRDKILSALETPPMLNRPVYAVTREHQGVRVMDKSGNSERFDYCIVATHADEALALLPEPLPIEHDLLSCFQYSTNRAILHCDTSVLPPAKRAWVSWNYRLDGHSDGLPRASTHYWMNRLQPLGTSTPWIVSIDYSGSLNPELVRWQQDYKHPSFDPASVEAQEKLPSLNEQGPIFYCGSYFRYGFHEDAHVAGLQVVKSLKNRLGLDHEILPV